VIRAVLFDVDFTIARPGPELGPEGYQRLGERFGLLALLRQSFHWVLIRYGSDG